MPVGEVAKATSTNSRPIDSGSAPPTTEVNTEPAPERKPRRTSGGILATPSISQILNGDKSDDSGDSGSNLLKPKHNLKEHPFDQHQLNEAWKVFAGKVDAAQLKSALSVREPILQEDFCVVYNLDNEVQRQRITLDLKPKLLAYLHKTLKNDRISIEFNVTESQEEILNKPYTEQEKFNTLMSKYPALGILKQRFGLDFE